MPVADPFKNLNVTTAEKTIKNNTPTWEGPIPNSVVSWVQTAVDDNVKVTIPVPDGNQTLATQLRAAITAEVKTNYPGLAAHVRDIWDDDTITGVSFTIGAPRGRKAA